MAHEGLGAKKSLYEATICGDLVKDQKVITIDADLPVESGAEVCHLKYSSTYNNNMYVCMYVYFI